MSEMTREEVITALRHPLNNTCHEAQLRNEQVLAHDAAQRQTIAQLEAALKQEQTAHEEDVAQLVKHCACEWEGEEPRRQTVTCGTHQKLEARVSELEALYANSCSALNAHMEVHAEVVNWVKELEAEVVRLTKAMDPIDQECCDLQAKWKAEAQWAANELDDLMQYRSPKHVLAEDPKWQRAQRILSGL